METFYSEYGKIAVKILIIAFATAIVAIIVRKIGDKILKRLSVKEGTDLTSFRFIQHFLTSLFVIIGFGLIIYMIPGLRHVAQTLITGAGILAIVIGFASQAALSNIISGIFIVLFKPYRIKDRVTIKDTLSGIVEDISLRHTVIRNFENKRIIIPNSIISNEVIVNSDFNESRICKWVDISIGYGSDIDLARKIMKEEAENHPNTIDNRTPVEIEEGVEKVPVRVIRLGEYSVDMRAWVWAMDSPNAFIMHCELLESIKKRFDCEGVEIPFPYRNLYFKNQTPPQEEKNPAI